MLKLQKLTARADNGAGIPALPDVQQTTEGLPREGGLPDEGTQHETDQGGAERPQRG